MSTIRSGWQLAKHSPGPGVDTAQGRVLACAKSMLGYLQTTRVTTITHTESFCGKQPGSNRPSSLHFVGDAS
jgi:hypothetical protein